MRGFLRGLASIPMTPSACFLAWRTTDPITRPSLYAGMTAASPGSAEGAARALSGRERGWGVAGCIMGMPEYGSSEIPGGGAVRLFAGGAGAAASVM